MDNISSDGNPPAENPANSTPGQQPSNGDFTRIVDNVMMMRSEFIKHLVDPRRDIEDECGYPKGDVSIQTYQDLYDRDAVAIRVVQVLPRECWQVQPIVYEDEDVTNVTPFEKAFKGLSANLGTEPSYYADDEENLVWEYLRRADELSGIGRYGIILLGLDDKKPLSEAADMTGGFPTKLIYIRTFPESLVAVSRRETDQGSERFGQPLTYSIQFDTTDPQAPQPITNEVHWTRVIHVADNLSSNELFGDPRMKPVLNRLIDLGKLYGGSAEMYWRGAFPGLSLETHPQLNPNDAKLDPTKLRNMMENYANGLQRYLALMGFTTKSLAPQVVDPTPQIRVQIEAICIRLGVPKRIFMGSERGELASAQDDETWIDRLKERQRNYITPRIIVRFVNRLINLGVLPKPKQYKVLWPDLSFQTEQDRARVAIIKTEAIIRYAESLPNPVIAPMDFYTTILGMPDKVAKNLYANVQKLGWDKIFPMLLKQAAGSAGQSSQSNGNSTFIKPTSGTVASDTNGSIRVPGQGDIRTPF